MTTATYPLRVEAELDRDLSRWLWLVKWILVLPHFAILMFLWMAYAVTTVMAFFAILFTARYPAALFEFNVGVLRWTWRVMYYTFGANGTDRYPPFSLREDPDYPTDLEVTYPERLSRGLVLVKWWLLAIPHYLILGVVLGGGTWVAWRAEQGDWAPAGNLLAVLVLVAVVVLAFRGTYPRGLFDLIMGVNRWALRVAAYADLMTDTYPPFRLDMGGREPEAIPESESRSASPPPGGATRPRGGWTGGRVTALVAGSMVAVISLGLLAGGGFLLWLDRTQRDVDGFLTSPAQRLRSPGFALVGAPDRWDAGSAGAWAWIGTLRVRAEPASGGEPLFVGVGPSVDVDRYLSGVARSRITDVVTPAYAIVEGVRPPEDPAAQGFWVARGEGPGRVEVTWDPSLEPMSVVVMNVSPARGVDVRADVAGRARSLGAVAWGLLAASAVAALAATALIAGSVRRAHVGMSRDDAGMGDAQAPPEEEVDR